MNTTTRHPDVQQILHRYETGELLADDDDLMLLRAADQLGYAYRHYYDGVSVTTWTQADYAQHEAVRQRLRQVEESILKLLITRYGCND